MDRYSVRLATAAALAANTRTGNVLEANANGALTVDGQSASLGDRVLVKNESTASKNGIYVVTSAGGTGAKWKLVRVIDMNTSARVVGTTTYVQEGTANAESLWACTNTGTVTLNSTSLVFEKLVDTSGGAAGQAFPPSADLAMGTHKITGLGNPTPGSQDAATAAYVDGLAGAKPRLVLASSVDQSVPTATLTKLAFPTVVENVGTFVVTSDTDIAVPAAGNYRASVEAKCPDGGGPIAALQVFAGATLIGEDQKVPTVPASGLGMIPDLVGYWPMNETGGTTINDTSAGGHTVVAANTSAGGAPAQLYTNCRSLNGYGISFGDIVSAASPGFSMAGWFNPGSTGNHLFSKSSSDGTEYFIRIHGGWGFEIKTPGQGVNSDNSFLSPGTWTHVAFTHDFASGTLIVYINNVARYNAARTAMPTNTNPLYMGYSVNYGNSGNFSASDFSVYARALTGAEVESLYSNVARAPSGTSMSLSVPGIPVAGQTFMAHGYANGLSAGDIISAKFRHEKGSNATLKGLGHASRITVEKL